MSKSFFRRALALAGAVLLAVGLAAWLSAVLPSGLLAAQDRPVDVSPAAKAADKGPSVASPPTADPATRPGRLMVFPPGSPEAAIEKALGQTVQDMDFDQTPLVEVVGHLARVYRIPILIDQWAFEGMSIDPKTVRVTFSIRGISLRSGLDLMLDQLGLTWTIRSEVLLITTPDAAETYFITKVYEVGDLVRCRDEKDVPWDDYGSLIDAIETTISRTSWEDKGPGDGQMAGQSLGNARVLIVTNTYRIQLEVAKLLEELRNGSAKTKGDGKPPVRSKPAPQPRWPGSPHGNVIPYVG